MAFNPHSTPVILDCDPGHDDAVAILLALGSTSLVLQGVTTVFGNCKLEDATQNALDVLALAGREDIPVASGASKPLYGSTVLGNYVHGASGLDGPQLRTSSASARPEDAVEWIADSLRVSTDPITIIATGPITNIANLIINHGDMIDKVAGVIFMGGSTERGNHTPYAEFNTYADPEALDCVISSGIDVRMVGLNLTHQALATLEVVNRFREMNSQLGAIVSSWMGFFGESYRRVWNFSAPPVHDPCTVAALIDPSLVSWQRTSVAVETIGRFTRGATVCDLDSRWPDQKKNVDVALELDSERYWNLLISVIGDLGRYRV